MKTKNPKLNFQRLDSETDFEYSCQQTEAAISSAIERTYDGRSKNKPQSTERYHRAGVRNHTMFSFIPESTQSPTKAKVINNSGSNSSLETLWSTSPTYTV